jgi:flagellar FliJ protein
MSRPQALIVALDVATRARDEARRALQDARASEQAAQDQMAQLQGYAAETQGRWGMKAQAVVQPEVMFHHYQFMDRLNHAMDLQRGVMDDHAHRIQKAQEALVAAEIRLASLKKLVERRQQELMQRTLRQDQKQTDERASLARHSATHFS